jgi:sugar fermentation stimulation protein A
MKANPDLPFGPLLEGTLLRRTNRFVVEVALADGTVVRAHTNNTGTMRTCSDPGSRVYLSESSNPNRKLKYSLHLVDVGGGQLVGVDTSHPQRLFVEAVNRGRLAPFAGYRVAGTEVVVAPGSRLDVLLDGPRPAWIELKNVTLCEGGRLYFPDAVTARGAKHLRELARLKAESDCDAFVVFIVQRPDGDGLSPADHIDPHFGETLREVVGQGVVPLAFRAAITPAGSTLVQSVPVLL